MEELQTRVEEPLGQVTSESIGQIYEHWIERLNQVMGTDGDYGESQFS
jgi:hypothetical protein